MRLELEIVGLLSREKELTINQISKKLKESYPNVHRKVNILIDKRVVEKKVYGNSHVCSLIDSDRTRAMLHLHEVERKEAFVEKNKAVAKVIEKLAKKPILCAIWHENKLLMISKARFKTQIRGEIRGPEQLKDISGDYVVLSGYYFFVSKLLKKR